jgi:hypothetical protein
MPENPDEQKHMSMVARNVTEAFFEDLKGESLDADAIARLRTAIIEEGKTSEKSLESALFAKKTT